MQLTVVICSHNRLKLLQKTIHSLNHANRPRGATIKILTVASSCDDGTTEWLRDYTDTVTETDLLPLSWVGEKQPGKSRALNSALSLVDTPIVAFVDDDHRVDPSYFEGIQRAVTAYPEVRLFCGRVLPDWDGSEPQWVRNNGRYRIRPHPVPNFDLGDSAIDLTLTGAIPGGGNLFVHRTLFDTVGRFSEDFGPRGHDLRGGEDIDFVTRALTRGERAVYVPYVLQYHHVDSSRLTLRYVMEKAYHRSLVLRQVVGFPSDPRISGVPNFLYTQLLSLAWKLLFATRRDKRRYLLVRLASTIGEMHGARRRVRRAAAHVE